MSWAYITPESVAGAVVGLTMLGVMIRNVITGWIDGQAKLRAGGTVGVSPTLALSIETQQAERFLALGEAMSRTLAALSEHCGVIAASQRLQVDQMEQATQAKLDELLARLEKAERAPRRVRARSSARKQPG